MAHDFPTTADAITNEWLSSVLGAEVTGFAITFLEGGVLADAFKLHVSGEPVPKMRIMNHLCRVLHYLDATVDELWRRLEIRNEEARPGTAPIKREDLEKWAQQFEAPDAAELALFDEAAT